MRAVSRTAWRFVVAAVFALAVPVATGGHAAADAAATLYATPNAVAAGATVTVSGRGYSAAPGSSTVEIRLDRRNGPLLASFPATAVVNGPVTIPANTALGTHTLIAVQYSPSGYPAGGTPGRTTLVVVPPGGPTAGSAGGALLPLGGLALALALSAAAVRARRTAPAPQPGRPARRRALTALVATAAGLLSGAAPASAVGQVRVTDQRVLPGVNAGPARGKNGPGLAVSPLNPLHVVETHQDLVTEECEVSVSHDGGVTWAATELTAPIGYPASAPGPCSVRTSSRVSIAQQAVAFGSGNTVYVAWLSSPDPDTIGGSVLLSKSLDGGASFARAEVVLPGGINPDPDYAAPEIVVDRGAAGGADRVYLTTRDTRSGRALVLRSDDSGATFAAPVVASSTVAAPEWDADRTRVVTPGDSYTTVADVSQPVLGPVPPGGGARPLYVAYVGVKAVGACPPACETTGENSTYGYVVVTKSGDLGATWTPTRAVNVRGLTSPSGAPEIAASAPRLAADRGDGVYLVFQQGPGVGGSNGCGTGPFPGRLGGGARPCPAYPNFPAAQYGPHFESDVYALRSIDKGATWGDLTRLNATDAQGLVVPDVTQATHPQVYVAPDGRVDVVWHDNRHSFTNTSDRKGAVTPATTNPANYACATVGAPCPEGRLVDTYYARSRDRGATFAPGKRITDRSSNADVGYGYRYGTYRDHGPVLAHVGPSRVLVADMDSTRGNYDTDAQDVVVRDVDLDSTPAVQVSSPAAGAVDLAVARSADAYRGGGEATLALGFTSRAWSRPVIVNEADFPAALAGGVLARANLAPLFASPTASLPTAVRNEISRLNPAGAFLLGDSTKLSAPQEAELVAAGVPLSQIVRIHGSTPAELAANIALHLDRRRAEHKTTNPPLPAVDAVVIANPNSASASAAAALAAARRLPILYVDAAAVPAATTAAIDALDPTVKIIVGDTAAVGTGVAATLGSGVTRLGGGNQYAVTEEVVKESIARGMSPGTVHVADGNKPMHAALLGATVARIGGLLMLAPGGSGGAAMSRLNALGLCGSVDRIVTSSVTGVAVVSDDPGAAPGAGPGACVAAAPEPAPETIPGAPTITSATPANGSATVTWSAPASDGNTPITRYVVRTSGPSGPPPAVTATGLSATVTGLPNGVPYRFTVEAVNAAGTGPASAPSGPVRPQVPTKVVVTSAPAVGTYGLPVTVAGKLTRADNGAAVGGQDVQLQYRRRGTTGAFTTAATVKSASTGAVTFTTFKPLYAVELRLVRPALENPFGPSTSPSRTALCQLRITSTLSAASVTLGRTATLSGAVAPSRAGKTIYLQRKIGTTWSNVTSRALTASSTYAFAIKPSARGTYYYRVTMKADTTFTTSYGPQRTLKVT